MYEHCIFIDIFIGNASVCTFEIVVFGVKVSTAVEAVYIKFLFWGPHLIYM